MKQNRDILLIAILLSAVLPSWVHTNATTLVGSMDVNAMVSESGGAALRIPIDVPSGVNGFQPDVALIYNSQGGLGTAGWGWFLSGVSPISRTGSDLHHDNSISGITFTNADNLTLGGQRLMLYSGTHFSSGSVYHTEVETFSKITYRPTSSCDFQIQSKEGTVTTYANSINYQLSYGSNVLAWYPSATTDNNGNTISYTYSVTNGQYAETLLSAISYAGGDVTIEFIYGDMQHPRTAYLPRSGNSTPFVTKDTKKLTRIDVKSHSQLLYSYILTYNETGTVPHLTSVKKQAAGGDAYPPTSFVWETASLVTTYSTPSVSVAKKEQCLYADFNGDGKTDVLTYTPEDTSARLYINTSSSTTVSYQYYSVTLSHAYDELQTLDFNGDGKTDIVGKYGSYLMSNTHVCCELSSGSSFAPFSTVWDADYTTAILTGDYDGDGMDDILISSEEKIVHNDHSTTYYSGISESLKDNYVFKKRRNQKNSMDFNGNGKEDIFVATADDAFVYELASDGDTFNKIATFDFSANGYNECDKTSFTFGDYNGDGNTDFIYYGQGTNTGNVLSAPVRLSTGRGFVTGISLYRNLPLDNVGFLQSCDINHDGLSDVVYILKNTTTPTLYILTNYGNSFSSQSFALNELTTSSFNNYKPSMTLADLYGTGRAELTCFKTDTQLYAHSLLSGNPQLIKDITSTIGTDVHFTYMPLTDSAVYGSYGSASFPYYEAQIPLYVVRTHTEPYVSETYRYRGCLMHRQGRGFLGYRETTVTDNLNQRKHVTTRVLNSTYKFLYPNNETVSTLNGTEVETTDYTYGVWSINGSTNYFPYVSEQTHENRLTTLSETEERAYDNKGNLLSCDNTKGDMCEHTSFSYVNAGSWCPNKVSQATTRFSMNNMPNITRITTFTYDSHGNKTSEVNDPYAGNLTLTHQYTYSSCGNLLTETVSGSGQSRTTSYTYSSSNRFPASRTDELGMVTNYTHNETTGLLTSQADSAGTTTYTYDTMGRLLTATYPDGIVESKSRQLLSNGTNGVAYSETDYCTGKSPVTTYYNAAGVPLCELKIGFGNHNIYRVFGYNPNGSKQFVSVPFFSTTYGNAMSTAFTEDNAECYTYDNHGRLLTVKSPSVDSQYTYNGLTTSKTEDGASTSTTLNNVGWVVTKSVTVNTLTPITDDNPPLRLPPPVIDTRSIQYTYYPNGLVKSITPAGSETIHLQYDLHGNRTQMIDPDAGTITSTYNAFDQLTGHSQAVHSSGQVQTTYAYETNGGRLLSETVNGNDDSSRQYAYDARFKNKVASITDQDDDYVAYSYDSKGRLIREERTAGTMTLADEYTYSSGHVASHKYMVDNVTKTLDNFTYDALGNMTREALSNSTTVWELLETNARGQVLREQKGNIVTTYTYDAAGRVLTISAPGIQDLTYEYDENGNVLSKEDANASHKAYYTYDGLNRLTSWRTESPYLHQLSCTDTDLRSTSPVVDVTHTISYDDATGNIIAKSDLGSNASFSYTPTSKPHALRSVSDVATDWGLEDLDITYTDRGKVERLEQGDNTYGIQYAADGRRIKSHLIEGNSSFTIRYYGNGIEKAYNGVDDIDYLTYLCRGAIVVHHEGDGGGLRSAPPTTPTAILQGYYDAQGSLIALVDGNGTVVRRFAYDPWGKRVNPADWTQPDTSDELYHINRGYTMHEHLDDFGLINMNGRVFDPAVAQFLSPDEYIQNDGNWLNFNRYAYCVNNPLKYTDPSGEFFATILTFVCDLSFSIVRSGAQALSGEWNNVGQTWKDFNPFNPTSRTAKAWQIDKGWIQSDKNLSKAERFWQITSRFTWELPQSILGYLYLTSNNIVGNVDRVEYFGGATYGINENLSNAYNSKNVSLGSFIHMNDYGSVDRPFDQYVCSNPTYMHEYGHYLESQYMGLFYLPGIGVPSLLSQITEDITNLDKMKETPSNSYQHKRFYTEKWANTLAADYFAQYGVNWAEYYYRDKAGNKTYLNSQYPIY